ncbi:hypothetical protein [Actinomadura algeriensis]|uniref:Uncharacterized protein n=1 Tax=Actinomadura algeriensis TaxID=1679523 RepID=A0ABR9JNG3_9ACTN|nr:hypothetical protein [Actinomadura algeriensis]MBE1532092.1 hypothetical protein [Actinomadura algeriensis]
MAEVGANPGEVVAGGREAGAIAVTFTGLTTMFQAEVDTAYLYAAESPLQRGYARFGEDNAAAMARVQRHGEALSGNVEAAGSNTAFTDHTIEEENYGVRELLLRDLNYQLIRE